MIKNIKRGQIYEFDDGKRRDEKRYVLIVSSNKRARDRYLSTIWISNNDYGSDVIELPGLSSVVPEGYRYVHCGMVTYVNRDYIKGCVGSIDNSTMMDVESMISTELSIHEDDYKNMLFYKEQYEKLLEKVVRANEQSGISIEV